MEKSQKLKPLPFCLKTELLKLDITDDSVKLTLKLPPHIDLKKLHIVLSEQFNLSHSHSQIIVDDANQTYLFFIGSL